MSPPIDKLHFELLARVLALSLTSRPDKWGYTVSPSPEDVLVFCQVCKTWRAVVIDTPGLWMLETFPLVNSSRNNAEALAITRLCTQRSTPLPMSICLRPSPGDPRIRNLPEVLDALVSASHRWKSLRIVLEDVEHDLPILSLRIPVNRLEQLEKVWLDLQNNQIPEDTQLDVFTSAPRLCDVTLEMPNSAPRFIIQFPWTRLTRLSLNLNCANTCLETLTRCSNLVSASVTAKRWPTDLSPSQNKTSLLYLEELRMQLKLPSRGTRLIPYLYHLELPALRSLSLFLSLDSSFEETLDPEFRPVFTSFLARSPNLTRLCIGDAICSADLPEILTHTPSLAELTLNDIPVDDLFLTALRCRPGPADSAAAPPLTLVPQLESLEITEAGDLWEESTLFDMIRSRCNPPRGIARLKRLVFGNRESMFTNEFIAKTNLYRREGLEMELCIG